VRIALSGLLLALFFIPVRADAQWGIPEMAGPVIAQMALPDADSLFPELQDAVPTALPVYLTDGLGYTWDIQYDGGVSDGTSDAFDSSMMIDVDGSLGSFTGAGYVSSDGREVLLPPTQVGYGLWVFRRVRISADQGYARWLDVLYNPGDVTIDARVTHYMSLGSDDGTVIVTTTDGDSMIGPDDGGWVTDDMMADGDDPAVGVIYSDGSMDPQPMVSLMQSSDSPTISYVVEVQPGDAVALVLFSAQRTNREQASDWLATFDPATEMSDITYPVLNFGGGGRRVGGPKVSGLLRGDRRDVVELRSGDRLEGTILDNAWQVTTRYGDHGSKLKDVAGILFTDPAGGEGVLVTRRGEVFVGSMGGEPVAFKLPGGRKLSLPRDKIARIGLRLDEDEGDFQPTEDQVILRRGDHLHGKLQGTAVTLTTPYGTIEVPLDRIAGIDYRADGDSLHRVTLADGSVLSGLLLNDAIEFKHRSGQTLTLGWDQLAGIVVPGLLLEPAVDPTTPVLTLVNGDRWYARPANDALTLATPFGEEVLTLEDLRTVRFTDPASGTANVVLGEGGSFTGRVVGDQLVVRLTCGLEVELPVAFVGRLEIPVTSDADSNVGQTLPIRLGL